MRTLLRRLLGRLKRVRFSLATLLLLVLTLAAAVTTWVNRHPWELVRTTQLPDTDYGLLPMADSDEMLVWSTIPGRGPFIWDSLSGKTRPVALPAPSEVAVDLARRKRLLATTDSAGTARVRDLDTGDLRAEVDGFSNPGTTLCFSDDGEVLAGIGPDGGIRVHGIASRLTVRLGTQNPLSKSTSLELSSNGRYLQVNETGPIQKDAKTSEGCIDWCVFDCSSATRVEPPAEIAQMVRAQETSDEVSFQLSQDRIFVGNKYWVVGSNQVVAGPGRIDSGVPGRRAGFPVYHTAEGVVEVRSSDMGAVQGQIRHSVKRHGVYFTVAPGGNRIVSCGYCACWYDDPSATVWDLPSGQPLFCVPHVLFVTHFLRNGSRIAGITPLGQVQVWQERWTASSWGILGRPEVWLTLLFLAAAIASIRRDRRMAQQKPESQRSPTPGAQPGV